MLTTLVAIAYFDLTVIKGHPEYHVDTQGICMKDDFNPCSGPVIPEHVCKIVEGHKVTIRKGYCNEKDL